MKKILYVIFLLIIYSGFAHAGDFIHTTVDFSDLTGELMVAPARNDGINRLYATGSGIYEYTWQDSIWVKDTVQESPPAIDVITAGFGRNDGVWRLYAADDFGWGLYEYTFNGMTWDRMQIESVIDVGGSIAIGDIKNDDTLRVVAGGHDNVTMAYTYQTAGNTWRAETLGVNTNQIFSVVIGKGRNDDTNRVYSGGSNTQYYEYWFKSGFWDKYNVYAGVRDAILGKGRNDIINRLYFSGLVEKTWDSGNWLYATLDTNLSVYGGQSVLTDGRNDGKNRVYVASNLCNFLGGDQYKVYVLEKTYDSTTGWVRKEIPATTSSILYVTMGHITSGKARNDSINRLYVCSTSSELFEFTWVDSINGVVGEPVTSERIYSLQLNQNYPNPFNQATVIRYQATGEGPVKLAVYNIAGQLVRTLTPPNPPLEGRDQREGSGSVTWDGRDSQGNPVISGLYFYCLEAGGIRRTKKMVLIR